MEGIQELDEFHPTLYHLQDIERYSKLKPSNNGLFSSIRVYFVAKTVCIYIYIYINVWPSV